MISLYIFSNTGGNATAIFDNTFLSSMTSFLVIVPTNVLYLPHISLITADNLSIHNFLKSLFFSFLFWKACWPCFTNANLTCLWTFFLPSLNPVARTLSFLCLLCLCNPFFTLTITIYHKEINLWSSFYMWKIILCHKDAPYCFYLCLSTNGCYLPWQITAFLSS